MKYIVTGASGFIGFHLALKLLEDEENYVIGIDNMNEYYDINLKKDRLKKLSSHTNYKFYQEDISNKEKILDIFKKHHPDCVINLAAQAGVRYSIEHPDCYITSNIIGFYNILEACRKYPVKKLLFASSSSVYGANTKVPYCTDDYTDHPLSLYAATKKSNELLAYSYSNLYNIPAIGLRFFTVYGPMGRPDMAYFSFTKNIMQNQSINVFNNGDMYRDFTYIDDIIKAIYLLININIQPDENNVKYKVYNIGNNKPVKISTFIDILEKYIGKKATKKFLPMQDADVYQTYANIDDLINDINFKPTTSIEDGLKKFVDWYKNYYS